MIERGQDAHQPLHLEDGLISLADELPERVKYTVVLKRAKLQREAVRNGEACHGETSNNARRR
jgi:hypothetical protein